MSLQFILGGSGMGKSGCLYEQVIRRSLAEPEAEIILLVPEQYTMLTQRQLARRHPRKSVLNVDVLSFERLAYRIFEETGTDCGQILDDTGKSMILRRILSAKKDELQAFGGNAKKSGFVDQVKSMLSELLQYGIDPDMLREKAGAFSGDGRLFAKLRDIGLIYAAFLQFLGQHYMTTEQVLDRLCSVIGRSERIRRAVIYLDNYTGFTPVQYKLMTELLQLAPEVVMTLCTDTGDLAPVPSKPDKDELFFITRETLWRLDQICRQYGVARKEDILLGSGGQTRFAGQADLSALERNLYRTWISPYHEIPERISLMRAASPDMEMQVIAARIRRMVRKEGLRYQDIAVIASDMETYQGSARYWFSVYEIPCFIDARRAVSSGMAAEWIRSLLDMLARGFTRDTVFRFLRCGLSDLSREEVDRLDNYVLAKGIRGARRWSQEWTARSREAGEEELAALNQIRERFMTPLEELTAMAGETNLTFARLVRGVYRYMTCVDLEGKLEAWRAYFADRGDLAREREYEQVYDTLIGLMEKIYAILGEEEATIREFAEIFESGLRQLRIGIIPPALDQVTFGDTMRTRLSEVKVVFFAGLNDNLLPHVPAAAGMITDRDRESLAKAGLALAPTARDQMCTQRFYIYAVMTKPSRRLILSRSMRDASGSSLLPASLIEHLRRIFPALSEESFLTEEDLLRYPDTHQAYRYLAEGCRQAAAGEEIDERWQAVKSWYMGRPDGEETLARLLGAAESRYTGETLSEEAVSAIYEGKLTGGVTMLEKYAQCAYAHFLQYGLRLQERETYEVGAPDIGNIFHRAIELFSRRVSAGGGSWRSIGDEARDRMAAECVAEAVSDYRGSIMKDSSRAAYITEKITRMTKRTVWILQQQIRKGDFEPAAYEVKFSAGIDREALELAAPGGIVSLHGKVDRLDVLEEDGKKYLRIIDYKTGSTGFDLPSIFGGIQLQLVVYMNAVAEREAARNSRISVIPAGIFYYRIDEPFSEADNFTQCGEIASDQEISSLALDGLAIGDEDVVRRMDRSPQEPPDVLRLKFKNGILQEGDHLASLDDYLLLSSYIKEKTEEIGQSIFAGRIPVNPYRDGGSTACGYCPYRGVCGFDERTGGYRFRPFTKIRDKKQIWNYLAERRRRDGSELDTAAEGSDTVEGL